MVIIIQRGEWFSLESKRDDMLQTASNLHAFIFSG